MTSRSPLAVLLLLLLPSTGSADDWLALHPECAFDPEERAPGRMAIVYPRPGLPAVVEQGERLVARVRVPSGLTPPPGIQQDRALVGWSSELVGYGVPLEPRVAHRYPLRVVDVRPDGSSSLIYRASIRIPHWAAPGTYALRMTAPGGGDAVAAAVRIIEGGEAPRVALLGPFELEGRDPAEALARLSAVLGRAPVDAWIAPHDPGLRAALDHAAMPPAGSNPPGADAPPAPPILLLPATARGLPVALRHGDQALVLGSCDGRFVGFDEQLAGLLAREGRSARRLVAGELPPAGRRRSLTDAEPSSVPLGAETASFERTGEGGLSVHVPAGAYPVELTAVLADDGRATRVDGAHVSWWPATPVVAVGTVPALAARLRIEAGATVTIRRGEPSPLELSIAAEPTRIETGIPVGLTATPSREVALVAWQLDEDITAVGPSASRAWAPLGRHRVAALAIAPDGVGARARTTVRVVTREKSTCDCGAAPGRPAPLAITGFLPLLGFVVWRVRRARNIRAPKRRCQP